MRILHTMIRVGELERSIEFYTQALELTHNWDTKSYDLSNGYGHGWAAAGSP